MKFNPLSQKGVAIHAVVVVILIAFGIFFLLIILGPYLNIQNCELNVAICTNQRLSFCFNWWAKDQSFTTNKPSWRSINTCERVDGQANFYSCPQPSADDCRELVKQ